MNWLRSHLVDDWHSALSWSSVRLHVAAAGIGAVYTVMPVLDPSIANALPGSLQAKAIGLYALGGLVLRVTKLKGNG